MLRVQARAANERDSWSPTTSPSSRRRAERVIVMYARQNRGAGSGEGDLQEAAPSLYPGLAPFRCRERASCASRSPRFPARRPAFRSAARLRLRDALPQRIEACRQSNPPWSRSSRRIGPAFAMPSGEVTSDEGAASAVDNLRVGFPVTGGVFGRASGDSPQPVDGVSFTSIRAKRWALWANPAAARRPWRAHRPRADAPWRRRILYDGLDGRASRRPRCGPTAARADGFPGSLLLAQSSLDRRADRWKSR